MSESTKKTYQLDIVTPEKAVLSQAVTFVAAPALEGEIGVLPQHAPFLSPLSCGVLKAVTETVELYYAVNGGFVEVNNNHMSVLADCAEAGIGINVEEARDALAKGREALTQIHDKSSEKALLKSIKWAETKLKAAQLSAVSPQKESPAQH